MANVFGDDFPFRREGLSCAMVARDAGARELGGTVYELAPHTVDNPTDEPVRFLVVSTSATADVVEYPEDGTVRAVTGLAWALDPDRPHEDQFSLLFERASARLPQT